MKQDLYYGYAVGQDSPEQLEESFWKRIEEIDLSYNYASLQIAPRALSLCTKLRQSYGIECIQDFLAEYERTRTILRTLGYNIGYEGHDPMPLPFGYRIVSERMRYQPVRFNGERQGKLLWESFERKGAPLVFSSWREAWIFCFLYSHWTRMYVASYSNYQASWWIAPYINNVSQETISAISPDDASIQLAKYLLANKLVKPDQLEKLTIQAKPL